MKKLFVFGLCLFAMVGVLSAQTEVVAFEEPSAPIDLQLDTERVMLDLGVESLDEYMKEGDEYKVFDWRLVKDK